MRYIDADKFIGELHSQFFYDGRDRTRVYAKIQEQPTAEVREVVRGEWTEERLPSTSGGTYQVWRCSNCKQAFNWRMNYCGNCGARMGDW